MIYVKLPREEINLPAKQNDNEASVLAMVTAELQQQKELTQLFESRYNRVHQENLSLELQVMKLRDENARLTANQKED